MKKSLVLAMAMALGVTASAYAANPFSDVPAGHWAYDSISKLAAAGIIEGYGDDTFRGDRLMTRYEMAQIVAKALAKGANVDRLAAEFADELDALGVRVAALEKKSDNVKITGYFRYDYATIDPDNSKKDHRSKLRTRLWFNGKVNDNWNYVGMIQNDQDLKDNVENNATAFQRAYLQGRLGGLKVLAGRYNMNKIDGELYNNRFDGIDATYGDKVKFNAYYGKPTDEGANFTYAGLKFDRMWGVDAATELGKVGTFNVGYHYAYNAATYYTDADEAKAANKAVNDVKKINDYSDGILDVGLKFKLGKDFNLGAHYLHTNIDDKLKYNKSASDNGFFVKAAYKGAKAAKPGSWGLAATYYQMPAGGVIANGFDYPAVLTGYKDAKTKTNFVSEGFKGFYAQAKVTVAKNMVAGIQYWDLKGRESDLKNKATWADFIVTF